MTVQVTGLAATSSLGSVTPVAKAGVSITGVSATGELENPLSEPYR